MENFKTTYKVACTKEITMDSLKKAFPEMSDMSFVSNVAKGEEMAFDGEKIRNSKNELICYAGSKISVIFFSYKEVK